MKIICSVEVLNRTLPSLNMTRPNRKPARSSLTLGKSPDNDIFLFHQPSNNSCGKKYKIKDIANVFVKFIHEGKATIRFRVPEHDLAIKSDPIQLKGFLKTLKLGLDGSPSFQISTLNTDSIQKNALKPIKTKLKITSKDEYPVLEGFPRTLQDLTIANANQNSLDSRILRLRNLRVLNLENNNLTTLPEQLGSSLPLLAELYLSGNSLGLGKNWNWIISTKLQSQLRLLDLRSNQLTVLPAKIVKLIKLVTLKLDNNNLSTLPNGISCLKQLRYFSASNNKILCLPRSLFLLKLESIDLSGNMFCTNVTKKLYVSDFQLVPSLVDLCASQVITNSVYYSEEIIPQTLIDYIESSSFCVCGKPCLSSQPESHIPFQDIWCRTSMVVSSSNCVYSVAVRFCSYQCYIKHDVAR